MQLIVTVLTMEPESLLWAVLVTGIATFGTGLGSCVGIHFDGHRTRKRGLVGDHVVEFSKRLLRVAPVGFACFRGDGFCPCAVLFPTSFPSPGAFTDVGQLL